MTARLLPLLAAMALAGCGDRPARVDGDSARPVDSVASLIEQRVPRAVAGDTGWRYQFRLEADLDGDGSNERAILLADPPVDRDGWPVWEDGHRWQMYIEESDSSRTWVYARFVPMGQVHAHVIASDSGPRRILITEETPHRRVMYEIDYRGPDKAGVSSSFVREIDAQRPFDRILAIGTVAPRAAEIAGEWEKLEESLPPISLRLEDDAGVLRARVRLSGSESSGVAQLDGNRLTIRLAGRAEPMRAELVSATEMRLSLAPNGTQYRLYRR